MIIKRQKEFGKIKRENKAKKNKYFEDLGVKAIKEHPERIEQVAEAVPRAEESVARNIRYSRESKARNMWYNDKISKEQYESMKRAAKDHNSFRYKTRDILKRIGREAQEELEEKGAKSIREKLIGKRLKKLL